MRNPVLLPLARLGILTGSDTKLLFRVIADGIVAAERLDKRIEELEYKNRLVIETLADMCRRADVPFIADLGLALGGLVDQVPPDRMAMYEEQGQRLLKEEARNPVPVTAGVTGAVTPGCHGPDMAADLGTTPAISPSPLAGVTTRPTT